MSVQPPNPFTADLPLPFANPALLQHSELFKKKAYKVGNSVWVYVGWNLANIIFVAITEGENTGLVVVDTGEDLRQMEQVWVHFHHNPEIPETVRNLPLIGIILTHHHADHVNGTKFLLPFLKNLTTEGNIVGAANLNSEFAQENGLIAPLMSCRAMAQYNYLLEKNFPEECVGLNSGIGPIIDQSITGYVAPNKLIPTVTNTLNYVNFGTDFNFEIIYVPSEANSEIAIHLPWENILLSAEVIQDHTFPNLYTLRGANFRDPSTWAAAIDTFTTMFPNVTDLVLQHGPPILKNSYEGNTISEVLTRYRDAIQLVHDQTLRWAMKGYAKDEIMHLVKLPPDQSNFKPWLQEFYGTVKHSVPAVYTGYIGWFDGDPIALDPTPRSEYAARVITLMGGAEKVFNKAKDIFLNANTLTPGNPEKAIKEWQFAAELATLIIRQYPEYNEKYNPEEKAASGETEQGHTHAEGHKGHKHAPSLFHRTDGDVIWWNARYLKAACFRQIAYRAICANWRGTYLTAAHELEGVDLLGQITSQLRLATAAVARAESVSLSLTELAVRLQAENAETAPQIKLGLSVTDPNPGQPSGYLLILRNCVLFSAPVANSYVAGTPVPGADVTISATNSTINVLLGGDNEGGFNAILHNENPRYSITYIPAGDASTKTAVTFFSYFEVGRYTKAPNIYVH